MILIDALYICQTGGKNLLDTLVENLDQTCNEHITILIDNRISEHYINKRYKFINIEYLKASEINRFRYYIKNRNLFRKVFCLANVPPPVKLNCQIMIFFQNILFFDKKLQKSLNFKNHLLIRLKAYLIKSRSTQTQQWVVQTKNVRDLLKLSLHLPESNIFEYPFFEENSFLNTWDDAKKQNIFFYPAIGANHKNHHRLLCCWEELFFENKIKEELHITVPFEQNSKLEQKILSLQKKGVPIVNHGLLTKAQVNNIYSIAKYVIHPSLGESFGLVLIEALKSNCILLAPNLPYVNAIVGPHYYFDPYNIDSMKRSILRAINNESCSNSKILIENKLNSLITHLLK